MRTSNPAFRNAVFTRSRAAAGEGVMTLGGTVGKTLVLLALAIGSTVYTWRQVALTDGGVLGPLLLTGTLGGLVTALVLIFNPRLAPWLAPLYAVLEGLALGGISAIYDARYRGLPAEAVALTFAAAIGMLVLYRTGVIRATARFRAVLLTAALGLMLYYLVDIVLGFFGTGMPLVRSATPLGIAFSVVACGLAALFFILDFDMVEEGVRSGAPKHLEWYGGFSILMTAVWLYLEILRLLGKLRR
jgi:uncharacterized YccA/Bax inhibitor family protein